MRRWGAGHWDVGGDGCWDMMLNGRGTHRPLLGCMQGRWDAVARIMEGADGLSSALWGSLGREMEWTGVVSGMRQEMWVLKLEGRWDAMFWNADGDDH